MPAFYSRVLKDYDGENTTLRVAINEINAGNIADIVTQTANFGAALNDITLGSLQALRYGNETISASPPPADPYAQRELAWLVRYTDNSTGKRQHMTIGTADPTMLDANNRGFADPDKTEVAAFIDAFEAMVVSDAGNAVTVESIQLVGRNI